VVPECFIFRYIVLRIATSLKFAELIFALAEDLVNLEAVNFKNGVENPQKFRTNISSVSP